MLSVFYDPGFFNMTFTLMIIESDTPSYIIMLFSVIDFIHKPNNQLTTQFNFPSTVLRVPDLSQTWAKAVVGSFSWLLTSVRNSESTFCILF